jgi:hypothetical protein
VSPQEDQERVRQYVADATATAGELGVPVVELLARRCLSRSDALAELRHERDHYRARLAGEIR